MKQAITIISLLIISLCINAQNNIIMVSGKISDLETKEPIPFAGINIEGTSLGTISNIDGEFELKIQKKHQGSDLVFSCLGYKTQKCKISKNIVVFLTTDSYDLIEIVVKPLNAIEVLKEAIAKIPNNYQNKPTYLEAFYRNLFLEDTTYINLVEVSCTFNYAPYNESYNIWEAQKSYYTNKYLNNCSWVEGVNNYFDLYTSPNDQVKINEARISEYNSKSLDGNFVIGGPLNLIASDKVKYLNDFMDSEHFKHYKYSVEGITMFNGNEVIIVSFNPKRIQLRNHNPGYAKYINRKKYYNAEFKGKLFIERNSKAFVRIEYDLVKVKKRQRMQPIKRSVQIDYKKHNNIWYLSQISRQRMSKGFKKGYIIDSVAIEEQLIINKIETKNIHEFTRNETVPHSNYFTLNRYPTSYNKAFWNNFNIVTHNKLSKKATLDLQTEKTLEKQFEDMQKFNDSLPAPVAKKEEQTILVHNKEKSDSYKWLEKKDSLEVIKYLKAENKYCYNYFIPHREIQNTLKSEMIDRTPQRKEKQVYNVRCVGKYEYYDKYLQNNEYPILYRVDTSNRNSETIIFDFQKFSQKYEDFYFAESYISPNNKHIAFCIDTVGSEKYSCFIYDIDNQSILNETITNFWNLVWSKNGYSFYYIIQDLHNRPSSLLKHKLGTNINTDSLLYFEKDVYNDINIRKSKLGNYLFLNIDSYNQTETQLLNLNDYSDSFSVFYPRKVGHKYNVKEDENDFYILSNYNSINNRLYRTSKKEIDFKNWKSIILPKKDTLISSFKLTKDYVILNEVYNVSNHVRLINKSTLKSKTISVSEGIYSTNVSVDDYYSDSIYLTVSSFIEPRKYYSYNLNTQSLRFIRQDNVNNYNKNDYASERSWCVSNDSTKIPMTIIYKKNAVKKKKANPLILEGYGAYGTNNLPSFSIDKLSMLDRGFYYVIAHVRGSSVLGNEWYEQGRLMNKVNTFNDYISCAEHLISNQYTDSSLLFGIGGSAGGMLMGVVANRKPELFKGIVLEYPAVCFLDWLSASHNSNVLEFGNPLNSKYDFEYLYSYSPYENIKKQKYPTMLFISGYNDLRVPYWNATKMVAKLRDYNTGKSPILLKTYTSGHIGGSSISDYYESMAYEYSFILSQID